MPPTLADRLAHMLDAINNIEAALRGMRRDKFSNDLFRRMAVERLFEIISEASRHVSADVKLRQNDIDWNGIAALGNRLRHAYHSIDASLLWDIAHHDLPPLKRFVEQVIEESGQ